MNILLKKDRIFEIKELSDLKLLSRVNLAAYKFGIKVPAVHLRLLLTYLR